MNYKGRG